METQFVEIKSKFDNLIFQLLDFGACTLLESGMMVGADTESQALEILQPLLDANIISLYFKNLTAMIDTKDNYERKLLNQFSLTRKINSLKNLVSFGYIEYDNFKEIPWS